MRMKSNFSVVESNSHFTQTSRKGMGEFVSRQQIQRLRELGFIKEANEMEGRGKQRRKYSQY